MAQRDLGFNITALDNASKTFVKMAEQVERLSKKVDQLDRKDATVNVDADTSRASASLDRAESQADDLDGKEATIRVKIRGAAAAMAKVAGLTTATSMMSSGMASAASSITMLVAALPLISAAAVSATGAIGALASAVSVAGAGLAAFGAAAVGNVKKVTDVRTQVNQLNKELANTDSAEKRAKIIAERTQLLNTLTPAQNRMRKALDGVSQAYQKFVDTTAQPVARALTPWLTSVTPLLDALTPVVTEVSNAIAALGRTVRSDIENGFIGGFLTFIQGKAGGAVQTFGTIFLKFLRGMTGVIKSFWPLGQDLLNWLTGLMDRFARWANSPEGHRDMENFMKLVRDAGPKVWQALKNAAKGIGSLMGSFAKDGMSMLGIVADFFDWLSKDDNAERVKNALYGIAAALAAVGAALAISTGGLSLIVPAVAAMGAAIGYWFPEIKKAAKSVGDWFAWVFTEKIPQGWNTFKNAIIDGWNAVKGFFTTTIPNAWRDLMNAVSRFANDLWDDVVSTFKDGVNAVTGFLNKWFVKPLNKLLGVFNLEIPLIPRLAGGGKLQRDVDQMASGGRIGGGFKTNGPTAIVGEGNPRYPEYVIPTDPKYRSNARNLHEQAGSQLMASGGVVGMQGGGILDFFSDIGSGIWQGIKAVGSGVAWLGQKSWDLIKHGASWVLDTAVDPIVNKVKSILPENLIGDMGRGVIDKAYGGIKSFLGDKEEQVRNAAEERRAQGGSSRGRPTASARPAGQWSDTVNRALSMLGLPQSWAGIALQQIMIESGGNPNAVNRWDINAQRGTPSKGLLQTIGPTFRAHNLPGHNNILNPLDNVLAGMRYAMSRYGSLPNVWPTRAGYDQGGILPPGRTLAVNNTGKPEMVMTQEQVRAMSGQQPLVGSMTVYATDSGATGDDIARASLFRLRAVRHGVH